MDEGYLDTIRGPSLYASYWFRRGHSKAKVYEQLKLRYPWLGPTQLEDSRDFGLLVIGAGAAFLAAKPDSKLSELSIPVLGEKPTARIVGTYRYADAAGNASFRTYVADVPMTATVEQAHKALFEAIEASWKPPGPPSPGEMTIKDLIEGSEFIIWDA